MQIQRVPCPLPSPVGGGEDSDDGEDLDATYEHEDDECPFGKRQEDAIVEVGSEVVDQRRGTQIGHVGGGYADGGRNFQAAEGKYEGTSDDEADV